MLGHILLSREPVNIHTNFKIVQNTFHSEWNKLWAIVIASACNFVSNEEDQQIKSQMRSVLRKDTTSYSLSHSYEHCFASLPQIIDWNIPHQPGGKNVDIRSTKLKGRKTRKIIHGKCWKCFRCATKIWLCYIKWWLFINSISITLIYACSQ